MDENPYKSPREAGYREIRSSDPPAPTFPRTPWVEDRDAVFAVAALAFFIGAGIILAGLLGRLHLP